MRVRPTRRVRLIAGVLFLLAAVGVLVLRSQRAGDLACQTVRDRLPDQVGADIEVGRCVIDPLDGSVRVTGIVVTSRVDGHKLLSADEASISLRGVFLGGVAFQRIALIRPKLELDLSTAPSPAGATQTVAKPVCPLDELRHLRVGQVEIESGSVGVKLPNERSLKLEGINVTASLDKAKADVEGSVRSGSLELDPTHRFVLGRETLQAGLDLTTRTLQIDRLEGNVEGATVSATGSIEGLCDLSPALDLSAQVFVPVNALNRLGLGLPPASGQLWARVAIAGKVDAPTARAQLQATQVVIGPATPGDFTARVGFSGTTVSLEDFTTKAGDGELHVSGEVQLTQGFPATFAISSKDASLARVLDRASIKGAWVDFPVSVKGTVSGKLMPPKLGGDIEFTGGKFHLASRAFDTPKAPGTNILDFAQSVGRFHFVVSDQFVAFEDIKLHVGQRSQATGVVRIYFDMDHKGLDIRANADTLDLADFGMLAELPIAGTGSARVTILGPPADIVVDAQATLRDFKLRGYSLGVVQTPIRYVDDTLSFPSIVAQKGQTQYFADVALVFADALHVRSTLQMPDGRAEDVIEILRDLSPSMENVVGDITGRLALVGAFDCPVSAFAGLIAVTAQGAEYQERRLGDASAILRFEGGERLVLDPTEFVGPIGHTHIDGSWQFVGPLDFRLDLTEGSLAEVVDPKGKRKLGLVGALTSKGVISGTTDEVRYDGTLAVPEVRYGERALGASALTLGLVGRDLRFGGRVIAGVSTEGLLTMKNDYPTRAHFDVELPDLSQFIARSTGLSAALAGSVDVNGPLKNIDALRGTARLTQLSLTRGDVSATNVEPVELGWNAGALEVKSLSMRGPTMQARAVGRWGPATVDLTSSGSLDMRLLGGFTSSVERTQGRLDFTASFSGSTTRPQLAGSADLSDFRCTVPGYDLAVRSLSGHADFSESRVLISEVDGFLNDGRVKGRGDVRLERFSVKGMEFSIDLQDVTTLVQPELPATFSGTLQVDRRGQTTQLNGALELMKLRYTQQLSLESLIARARQRSVPSDAKPDEWLKLDVDLTAGNDVRIDNGLARARFQGKLKVTGTNVNPVIVGAIETVEGGQAFFRGNTYNVTRGLLQFNGLWPSFDLSAQTQVREYLVRVKAFGRLDDPKYSLASEPSLPEADLLSLLTLGVTSREKLNQTGGAGLAAEALLSASGLDQQVQRFLSQNVGLKDQQVRITTSFNEATGTTEPSVSWEGKVLTDNLKVGVTKPVTGKGTKAQAEYRVNPGMSVRAQWDDQNQNTSVGNPGVELKFHFEWE